MRTSLPPLDERPEKWPDNCFDEVAKVLLPFIRDYFASEKGQQEFAEWKRQKDAEERKKKKLSKREKQLTK